jgi:hypothetical protein
MVPRLDIRSHHVTRVVLFAALFVLGWAASAAAAAPIATVAPAITGVPRVLAPVTCTSGSWDQPAAFTFAWFVDGVRIDGETAESFTLRGIDRGHSVTCRVTASTAEPAATTASSAPIIPLPAVQAITGGFQVATGLMRSCGVTLARACNDRRSSGGKLRVGGVLTPARTGAQVVVLFERQRGTRWVLSMSRTVRVTATGSYFVTVPTNFFAATPWRVRTRVPETDVYAAAASPLRFVRIKP